METATSPPVASRNVHVVKKRLTLEDLTPAQRVRAIQKFRRIESGADPAPPLRCGECRSRSIGADPENDQLVLCVQCGKRTPLKGAHRVRRQELRKVIVDAGLGLAS